MEKVRLIIWDLDDTFWDGTLSEGPLHYRQAHHGIVVKLARRGIVSSICSKNDFAAVRTVLQQNGLWDYFVFPSVNWEPKGARVAAIIDAMQLRAPTVLFIDDNPAHLQEAIIHAPGLQVATPAEIAGLLASARCVGKDDHDLSRLAQYRLLERRHADSSAAGPADNTAFLRTSDIKVTIVHDVEAHIDRAIELINRTNQLNFTKKRLPEDPEQAREVLRERLRGFDTQAGLLRVTDSYGDYGFVGFYLVAGSAGSLQVVHFCFSCRILGMQIERWLYEKLGRPGLTVRGEVAADVQVPQPPVNWVQQVEIPQVGMQTGAILRIPATRIRGGCDGNALQHYFSFMSKEVLFESNTVIDGNQMRLDHSSMLRLCLEGADPARLAALAPLGFGPEHLQSNYFAPAPPGTVWIFSNWIDTIIHVYRHRQLGFRVPFLINGFGFLDMTKLDDATLAARLTERGEAPAVIAARCAAVGYLREHYVCEGVLNEAELRANLDLIFSRVPGDGRMFALLGPEGAGLPVDITPRMAQRQMILNRCLRDVAADYPAVTALDVNANIHDASEVIGLTHFDRMVYFRTFRAIQNDLSAAQAAEATTSGTQYSPPASPPSPATPPP